MGKQITPLKAIRAKCLDCSGGSAREVRECAVKDCPLFCYRMGKNPNITRRALPPEQRAKITERLSSVRENPQNAA